MYSIRIVYPREYITRICIPADKSSRLVVDCRQDAPLNREIRAHSRNMNLLNIRRHAPSPAKPILPPPFPPAPSTDVLFGSRRNFHSTFYQPRSTVNERLPPPVKDARRRDGKIAVRISRPVDAGLVKKKGEGIQSKQGLPGRRAAIVTKGLHLLTRTTAPLLITQSSGRRLRSAERPAPTPSPPTSTSTPTLMPISPSLE